MRNKLLGLLSVFIVSTALFLLLPQGGVTKTTEKVDKADNAVDFVYLVSAETNKDALASRIDLNKVKVNSVIYRWYPKSKDNEKVVPIRELYNKETVSVEEIFNSKVNASNASDFELVTKTTTLRTNSILGKDKVTTVKKKMIHQGGINPEKAKGVNPPKKIKLLIEHGGKLQYIEVNDLGVTTYAEPTVKVRANGTIFGGTE